MMTMMISGCSFLISNLDPFLDSYFWYKDKKYSATGYYPLTADNHLIILAGMMMGAVLFNKLQVSIKCLLLLASLIQIGGLNFALSANDYTSANFSFQFFNLGSGINIMLSLQCLWEYYPYHRGLMTGFVYASYHLGSALFNKISMLILNDDNNSEPFDFPD